MTQDFTGFLLIEKSTRFLVGHKNPVKPSGLFWVVEGGFAVTNGGGGGSLTTVLCDCGGLEAAVWGDTGGLTAVWSCDGRLTAVWGGSGGLELVWRGDGGAGEVCRDGGGLVEVVVYSYCIQVLCVLDFHWIFV